MSRWLILGVALATPASPSPADEPMPSIPVVVRAAAPKDPVKVGQPIPVTLTVENGLPGPVEFHTYAVKPNDWNGETVAVELVDIYRVGDFTNRFLAKPKVDPPRTVAGPSRRVVEPGKSLDVRIDASKWTIRDGWQPGTYTVTARVRVTADGGRVQLGVLSAPAGFRVKAAD